MRRALRFLPVLLLSLAVNPSQAATRLEHWSGELAVGTTDFGYREFDNSGTLLDREDGLLPGLSGRLSAMAGPWRLNARAEYLHGQVDYQGQTSTGLPHSTRTNTDIIDGALSVGRDLELARRPLYLYAGAGYHSWWRGIRSTASVSGINEIYAWWYVFAGGNYRLHDNGQERWNLDLRLTHTVAPTITIDFFDATDDVTLDLGTAVGVRLALQWQRRLNPRDRLIIEPFYEQWALGRSATTALTRNGSSAGTVYEPRSDTTNVGVMMRFARQW